MGRWKDDAYRTARAEHAWRCRLAGESYKKIGARLGVGEVRARELTEEGKRRMRTQATVARGFDREAWNRIGDEIGVKIMELINVEFHERGVASDMRNDLLVYTLYRTLACGDAVFPDAQYVRGMFNTIMHEQAKR